MKKKRNALNNIVQEKVKIVCNVAHSLMDATSLQKMIKLYPSKYRFLKYMLSPHKKSFEKLVNSNVSIHEKRKTLQKHQVGENLMIPTLNQILKK